MESKGLHSVPVSGSCDFNWRVLLLCMLTLVCLEERTKELVFGDSKFRKGLYPVFSVFGFEFLEKNFHFQLFLDPKTRCQYWLLNSWYILVVKITKNMYVGLWKSSYLYGSGSRLGRTTSWWDVSMSFSKEVTLTGHF